MKVRIALSDAVLSGLFVLALGLILPGRTRTTDPRTEILFWAMGSEGEHVGMPLPEFERCNPDLVVRLQAIPWTAAHEKLLTHLTAVSTPDVCQPGNTWIPEFVVLNAIEPLGVGSIHLR